MGNRLATIDIGQKFGLCPLGRGRGGSPSNTWPGLRPTSLPSGILIHPAVSPQQAWAEDWKGRLCTFGERELDPHLTQCGLGPRPTSLPSGILIHSAIWPQQVWVEIWGLSPFRGEGCGSPSNTMWPGPWPTCVPSFTLAHPTVWPKYTNVTDRQDRH